MATVNELLGILLRELHHREGLGQPHGGIDRNEVRHAHPRQRGQLSGDEQQPGDALHSPTNGRAYNDKTQSIGFLRGSLPGITLNILIKYSIYGLWK